MNLVFRPAMPADYSEVRRITREAYLHAGHFTADHPYMSVLQRGTPGGTRRGVGGRAIRRGGRRSDAYLRGAAVQRDPVENELEFRMLAVDPAVQGSGAPLFVRSSNTPTRCRLSRRAALLVRRFIERPLALYQSLGFQPVHDRDWFALGEDVPQWVFRLECMRHLQARLFPNFYGLQTPEESERALPFVLHAVLRLPPAAYRSPVRLRANALLG